MPYGLGEAGKPISLELADTLAADAQFAGERIVGSLVRRERASGANVREVMISLRR